jgi:histidyl-tRNA synthetase
MPWADVRKEMVDDKGLDGAIADRIETYVMHKGGRELLDRLLQDETLIANESAKAGLTDMALLMDYLEAFNCLDKISFDMSLARGLDYYTGVIYEVVTEGSAPAVQADSAEAQKPQKPSKKKASEDDDRSNDPTLGVGSVAAGGRYDNLVGMFLPKAQIPCVGVSFGVDRIFSITKARLERDQAAQALRRSEVDVYVMAIGGKGFNGMLKERMEMCQKLWSADIKVIIFYICFIQNQNTNQYIGRIQLQAEAQTPATIQGCRGRWHSLRPHSGRERTGRGQGPHQGAGSQASRRPPREGRCRH